MEMTHEHRLTAVEEKAARNEGRIKNLEESQEALHQLATSAAVLAEQMQQMNKNVDALTAKVDALEAKPAQRWDGVVDKVLAAIVGAFIAWALTGAAM